MDESARKIRALLGFNSWIPIPVGDSALKHKSYYIQMIVSIEPEALSSIFITAKIVYENDKFIFASKKDNKRFVIVKRDKARKSRTNAYVISGAKGVCQEFIDVLKSEYGVNVTVIFHRRNKW